jgi:hypothetical protein
VINGLNIGYFHINIAYTTINSTTNKNQSDLYLNKIIFSINEQIKKLRKQVVWNSEVRMRRARRNKFRDIYIFKI